MLTNSLVGQIELEQGGTFHTANQNTLSTYILSIFFEYFISLVLFLVETQMHLIEKALSFIMLVVELSSIFYYVGIIY